MMAITAPILSVCFIKVPTRNPRTRGTAAATMKAIDKSGTAIVGIAYGTCLPAIYVLWKNLRLVDAYWERVTLSPLASSTNCVGKRLLMKLTTFSSWAPRVMRNSAAVLPFPVVSLTCFTNL